ncbi:MAG TPA: DUF5801 repeats-in-toxin domain-containing protein, partial [Sphingomicrobium sp.]|nr:DUF5801 repeats-in-toxin domain-containing protein [Sphingomicrobium sp.]
ADTLVTLTATVTDKDGDHQAATANIGQNLAFLDDGPSISASTTQPVLTVDETVLATNATASFASVFTSAFGADGAGTVTYALGISAPSANSGLVDTATGSAIVLVLNGNVVEGHVATAGGALAFTVSVNAAGDVTLDQIRAVVHPNPLTPNESVSLSADNLVTLTATVTDKDGDHQSAVANIGQNLSFLDDAPALGTVQNQQTDNNPATTPAVGTLHFAPGADGAGSAMTITANVTGLLSGGHALVTHQVGNVLTAYQDIGPAGWDAGDTTQVFTITVNPAAGTSGQYVFDLITPLDPTVTETAITGSSSFGAGPTTQGQTLDGAAAQHLAVVSGYHMGGTFNEATWLSTGSAGPTTNYVTAGVNGSTAGWGIDNNNFNGTDEMFVWDFGSQALANPDGAGGFVPPAGVTLPDISTATFELIGYDSGGDGNFATGDDITYVVHYTDGSFDSGHVPEANVDSGTWKFTADAGKFIADIEMFASGLGSGKVDLTSVGVQNSSLDKSIAASVQLTDGDGDSTTVGNFTIHVSTGLVPFAPAAPVVLDLNGDGVHFLGHDAGVTFDYNGDGVREATGWVAPEDGILVRDANHNGTVDGSSEFVFGGGDVSDLQALHAQYGSSLDANDADFASFGVWQDANSNGNVDAGEVTSLTDAGINSISLSSDGIAYSANDDVEVAGTGSFTRADGSTGILADAVFLTRNADEDQRSVSAANTNTALIAALAAAGVAASPAAAHSVDLSSASTVAIAAAIVGSNAPAIADSDDGSRSALGGETKEAVGTDVSQPAHNVSPSSDDQSGGHSLTPTNDTSPATAPADLLEATDAPASAPANDIVSPTVAMPSAEALTGAAAQHGESEGAQASAVVGKVLVDALHGGGAEQSIDALLATLPGHGNAENAAADALASQPVGAVPTWDTGHLAAFTAHANFTMEAVALHHDAVQPVANG